MKTSVFLKKVILFICLIAFIVLLSIISNRMWSGKPESTPDIDKLIISLDMTIIQFGEENKLDNSVLKYIFNLKKKSYLKKKIADYGNSKQITSLVKKKLALVSEKGRKNWIKILVKFILWIGFLVSIFFILKNRKVTSSLRKWLLFVSVLIFGVIMGSDPGPMGTVKDAIHLYGKSHVIFFPRMIALGFFLSIVFLANKYICAWGCQVGTLQDLIFRINQNDKNKAVIWKQIKVPFVVSNTIRFVFLLIFTFIAFFWGTDIIEPIDPFKIFKPLYLGISGSIFVGLLFISSLFIYRPWCHFFCPFGFVGWIIEKISFIKISIDYEKCIACNKCANACPTTVMSSILKNDKKTIPDCFACYNCRDICPTGAISFSNRKRIVPPEGHFDK